MSKLSVEKIFKDIAIVVGISIAFVAFLRFLFDFNLSNGQVILRKAKLKRFDRCAVLSAQNQKISGLVVIGLPGDTVFIIGSEPYVNSQNISERFYTLFMIDLSNSKKISLDQFPVSFTYLSFKDYHHLQKKLFLQPVSQPPYMFDSTIYPYNRQIPWNKDNFGKFIIPHRGLHLKLNDYTFLLYSPLIKKYEHVVIAKHGKEFFVKRKKIEYYTFKKNYYFVLSKNLYTPMDSRAWGPLPRDRIIGKIIHMPSWTRLIITKIIGLSDVYSSLVQTINFYDK